MEDTGRKLSAAKKREGGRDQQFVRGNEVERVRPPVKLPYVLIVRAVPQEWLAAPHLHLIIIFAGFNCI